MRSISEFSDDDDRLGLAAAADRERAGQWPALDAYGELHGGAKYDRSGTRRSRAARDRDAANAARTASIEGERLDLVATGAWTAERAAELERLVDETAGHYAGARAIDIDLGRLERIDTFGAWLIERLSRAFAAHGSTTRMVGLSEADRGLMEEVRLTNRAAVTANAQTNPFVALLDGIGRSLADIGQSLVLLAHLLGALTKVTLGTLAHPARLIFGH